MATTSLPCDRFFENNDYIENVFVKLCWVKAEQVLRLLLTHQKFLLIYKAVKYTYRVEVICSENQKVKYDQ